MPVDDDNCTDEEIIESLANGRSPQRTICQVHRLIYRKTKDDPEVVDLIVEAFRMAKRMNGKLRWYRGEREKWWKQA